ncbi:MAG: hypothetical protein AAF502_22975 [Bacteroidota bacterium]
MRKFGKVYAILFLVVTISTAVAAQSVKEEMNNAKLGAILKETVDKVEGIPGNWQVEYGELIIYVLTDETNNRMRIFAPVIEEKDLETGQMKKMLEANFHSALDAKYSLFQEYVISVYTHPLRELHKAQFVDALQQVIILAKTFGDTYTSTGLIFRPDLQENKPNMKQN